MRWIALTFLVLAIVLLAHGLMYQEMAVLSPSGHEFQVYVIKGEVMRVSILGGNSSTQNITLNGRVLEISAANPIEIVANQTGIQTVFVISNGSPYIINFVVEPNVTVRDSYIISGVLFAGCCIFIKFFKCS